MNKFKAVIVNTETKETYGMFIESNSEIEADTAVYAVFDDLFYHEDTEEQDGYTHDLDEVTEFPKLPEDTVWTEMIGGTKYAIFKKVN